MPCILARACFSVGFSARIISSADGAGSFSLSSLMRVRAIPSIGRAAAGGSGKVGAAGVAAPISGVSVGGGVSLAGGGPTGGRDISS